jgi:cellulose synthase/poly-beta-1,6-N-acetylglucosamine synthase-like glycosyltransferase
VILALLGLALAALFAGMTAVNLRAYRPPPPSTGTRRVSVLVPARDEEANMGALLDALLASRGVDLEVIVLDDGSTDATAALVEARAARDPRVRLARGAPLPSGWIGKQHACAQLAALASMPLLAFVDADVRLHPDALARMANMMERDGTAMLSGFPRQLTGSWAERLVVPEIMVLLLGYLPFPMARRAPADPRFAAACGQVLVVRREAYDRAGGHAAMARTVHDGLHLARAVRSTGGHTDLADITDLASCRMYATAPEVWRGFIKNAREGMATPRALPVWTLLLGGGHILPVLTALWSALADARAALVVSLLALALLLAARAAIAARFRQGALAVLLHPAGVLATLVIQWTALLAGPRRLPATWRGRTYDV